MILEEKEAENKACCNGNKEQVYCCVTHCMAWRWIAKGAKMGYCGLAGEPRELNFQ